MKRFLIPALTVFGLGLLTILPAPTPATAHEGDDHGGGSHRESGTAPDEVALPKESQFLFEILTTPAAPQTLLTQHTLLGTVTAAPGGEGRVVAPQAGQLLTLSVRVGQRVRAGQVVAVLDQTLAAPDQLNFATARANAQAELRAAEADYQRLQSIRDIAARKDVVAAELRLRQARQNAALGTAQTRRVTLTAPISGVVEVFGLAAGQQVQAGDELLRVIDPTKLAVEAQAFADEAPAVRAAAQFVVETLPDGDSATVAVPARLVAFSNVVEPGNQAQRLALALADSAAAPRLRVGQRVQVRVQTRAARPQLAVPTSAVTDIDGKPAVFVHSSPEVFSLRFVRPGAADEQQTVILEGLRAGERVVTRNTYQLKSVYLNQ